MSVALSRKSMTTGEMGSALAFAALAFISIVIAAKAYTPEYAFHAYLFAAASAAAVPPALAPTMRMSQSTFSAPRWRYSPAAFGGSALLRAS